MDFKASEDAEEAPVDFKASEDTEEARALGFQGIKGRRTSAGAWISRHQRTQPLGILASERGRLEFWPHRWQGISPLGQSAGAWNSGHTERGRLEFWPHRWQGISPLGQAN